LLHNFYSIGSIIQNFNLNSKIKQILLEILIIPITLTTVRLSEFCH